MTNRFWKCAHSIGAAKRLSRYHVQSESSTYVLLHDGSLEVTKLFQGNLSAQPLPHPRLISMCFSWLGKFCNQLPDCSWCMGAMYTRGSQAELQYMVWKCRIWQMNRKFHFAGNRNFHPSSIFDRYLVLWAGICAYDRVGIGRGATQPQGRFQQITT